MSIEDVKDANAEIIAVARSRDGDRPPCGSPEPCRQWSLCCRTLSDGCVIHLVPMLYSVRLTIGTPLDNDLGCLTDGWDYAKTEGIAAMLAAATWSGQGDPPGPWIKQLSTGRQGPGSTAYQETMGGEL